MKVEQRMETYALTIQLENVDASPALLALTVISVETITMDLEATLIMDAKVRRDLLL